MPDSHVSENRAWQEKYYFAGRKTRRFHLCFSLQDIFLFNKYFLKTTKRGDICDEKSQISPLKWHEKGSFLLPCSKMPIGIFLFARKSDFQKSEENGEKRRKPEKISGFLLGIFFVKTH